MMYCQETTTNSTSTSEAASSSSSDESEVQVPCRARGQPSEHNYGVSFFFLPVLSFFINPDYDHNIIHLTFLFIFFLTVCILYYQER